MIVAITGITGGIGTALEHRLQALSWQVVGFSRTPSAQYVSLDMEAPLVEMQKVFGDAARRVGGFDAAVFLAGADVLSPPLRQAPYAERLNALWKVDVEGTVKSVQSVIPWLNPKARIVTTGWDMATLGMGGESGELYALAKGAVTAYSKSVARSLTGTASVAILAPGWVKTRWADRLPQESQSRMVSHTLAKQWQTPDEVAKVIVWMLQAPSDLITGQVIYANRGDVMPG